MNEEIVSLIDKYADRLTEFLTGPGAEAALLAYRLEAANDLITGAVAALVAVFMWFLARVLIKWAEEEQKKEDVSGKESGNEEIYVAMWVASSIVIAISVLFFLDNFLDAFTWAQIFHPEIGIVRDVMEGVR